MRIIDADRLMKQSAGAGVEARDFLQKLVDAQPTLLDLGNVCEEIDKAARVMSTKGSPHEYYRAVGTKKAKEIIMAGVNAEILAERPVASSEAISECQAGKTTGDVERLLNYLSEGTCKGIKSATVYRIRKFAEEMGLI